MSISPSIDDEIKAQRKLHPPLSKAFSRLEKIFEARYQPWCHFSISELKRRAPEPYTDADLRNVIHELHKDELARALVRACIHGDLRIAKTLWDARGPFEIEYKSKAYFQIINGSTVMQSTNAQHTFTNIESAEDLAELMEWMPTVGLGFMVKVGDEPGFLLESSDMEYAIRNVAWKSQFQGAIPTLSDKGVTQPELMLALKSKGEKSAYPKSFNDVLVWATPQMLDEFTGMLSPFESRQGLMLESREREPGKDPEWRLFPFNQCDETLMGKVSRRTIVNGETVVHPNAWDYHSLHLCTVPKSGAKNQRDNMALGYFAPEALKYGFEHKPGHVLCRTSLSFLSQFSIGQVDDRNLQKATEFTNGFFPLDMVVMDISPGKELYGSSVREQAGLSIGQGTGLGLYGVLKLYKLFGDACSIKEHVREALPRPLVQTLIDFHCKVTVDTQAMLALHQAFGMDNTGLAMSPEPKDLQALLDAGFKFSDRSNTRLPKRTLENGKLLTYERESSDHTDVFMNLNVAFIMAGASKPEKLPDEVVNSYANALRMGLWPAETERPESLTKALVMAARKKKLGDTNPEMALKTLIDLAGIDECANAAKSDTHWRFLTEHFGRDAITPYLKLTTSRARGRLLEDDLGL